jgi:hypothetical protein
VSYSEQRVREPIFNSTDDFNDGPAFDTNFDDLNGGTIFDEELFVATKPDSDTITVAILGFAKSECVVLDQEVGDLFTMCLSDVFYQELGDHTYVCFGFDEDPILNEGPLFDEEPDHGEEEPITDTELILGSIIVAAAPMTVNAMFSDTIVGTPFKCLMKCSGDGRRGWHKERFHEGWVRFILDLGDTTAPKMEIRSVISDSVEAHEFESKFWDPGLPEHLWFMELSRSLVDFHWDPGLPEGLQSIQFIRHAADFDPAHHHQLHIHWPYFGV